MNKPAVGIGVLIFNLKGEVLLGQRKNAHGAGTWAPPGGHLEFGETFADCAIREVKEETGIEIKDPCYVGLTNTVFLEEQKHYVSIYMRVDLPKDQTPHLLEPHKIEEWRWFNGDNLPHSLFRPLENFLHQEQLSSKSALKNFFNLRERQQKKSD